MSSSSPQGSHRSRSLQRRFITLFAITAGVLVSASIILSMMFARTFRSDISSRNLNLAQAIGHQVETTFDLLSIEMWHMSRSIATMDERDPSVLESMQTTLEYLPLLTNLHLLDLDGHIIRTVPDNPDLIDLDMSRQPFFDLNQETGSIVFSDSFISLETGAPMITMTARTNRNIVAAFVDLDSLSDVVSTGNDPEQGFIALTDRKGIVIAHSDPSQPRMTINISNLSSVRAALLGESGSFEEKINTIKGLTSYFPIMEGTWAVIVFQPYTGAFGLVDRMQSLTIFALLGALAISMLLSLAVIRRLLSPIKEMIAQTRRVSEGEYNVSIQPRYREFEELAGSFDTMARAIESRETELKANEEQYRSLFRDNPLPVFIFEQGTMNILDVNEAAIEDYGHSYEEFMGMTVLEIRPAEEIDAARDRINLVTSGRAKIGVWRHRRKNGEAFYVDITSHGLEYRGKNATMAICKNVTSQVEAEEALRDNQERLRATLESIGDAIVIIDRDMTITWSNRQAVKVFGLKEGDKCHEAFHGTNTVCDECSMERTFEDERVLQLEEQLLVAGGDQRTFLVATAPMYDPWGNVVRVVKSFKDIHNLKESERMAHKSLAEKEALLKEVHHRVKNNLQVVSGLLDMQAGLTPDLWTRKVLQDSQNRIQSMALIHEKLYQMEDLQQVDFGDYMHALVNHIGSAYGTEEKEIKVNVKCEEIKFNADTALPVGLIVTELVSNSFKHAFEDRASGTLDLSLFRNGGTEYTLICHDDGIGMPDDSKIESSPSLGVNLVRSYVAGLGGKIEMEEVAGTRYVITFSEYEECRIEDL
jgi:PAS domain S-box-containing protein